MKKISLCLTAAAACLAAHLSTASAQTFNIFPVDHLWRYMAITNDQSFCLNGTGWETSAFDDSTWPAGPGGFAGGEKTRSTLTTLAGLLNTTNLPAPSAGRGRPQYFRTHFTLGAISSLSLVLSNRIDDQAVFYLNGTRVGDYRHPSSPEACTPGGFGGDEATAWIVITLSSNQLEGIIHTGDNLLAVSVHQNGSNSADMVFACILSGERSLPPPTAPISFTKGTGVMTFDTAPPVEQWSTRTWVGAAGAPADFASLDEAAKTNDATLINVALTSVTGNPPAASATGMYAADPGAHYILTRPTAAAYSGLMATLQNNSGTAISVGIELHYDLIIAGAAPVEEVYGPLVYFSMSGTPGSWVEIPNQSLPDNTLGTFPKSGTLRFPAPWAPGALLYVLWVDDNGLGTPNNAVEIDNVSFSVPPRITYTLNGSVLTLSWVVSGTLQQTSDLRGGWADVTGVARNSYSIDTTLPESATRRFYRLR